MTRQPFEIRPARPRDAAEIAVIWHDGWRDGHLGHVPEELAAERTMRSFQDRASQRAAITPGGTVAPDGSQTVLATVGAAVAGFVMVVGDEVEQVYVSRVHRGSGVAGALLTEAERLVDEGGYLRAWLAVAPGNLRALRFYKSHGWTDDGPIYYPAAATGSPVLVPCRRYVKDLLRGLADAPAPQCAVVLRNGSSALVRPNITHEVTNDQSRSHRVSPVVLPDRSYTMRPARTGRGVGASSEMWFPVQPVG